MHARPTILVVDDDTEFRELYRAALRFSGFAVTTAADGLAALRAIDLERPSLIILDLNMPCLDGWAVLRELESHPATRWIPVIIITGDDVERTVLQAAAILRKPILPYDVLPLIERRLAVA